VVALLVSVGTSVFWIGFWFGALRGRLSRLREHLRDHGIRIKDLEAKIRRATIRVRDLERAHARISDRPYSPRYLEDQDPLPGDVQYYVGSVVATDKPPEKK